MIGKERILQICSIIFGLIGLQIIINVLLHWYYLNHLRIIFGGVIILASVGILLHKNWGRWLGMILGILLPVYVIMLSITYWFLAGVFGNFSIFTLSFVDIFSGVFGFVFFLFLAFNKDVKKICTKKGL